MDWFVYTIWTSVMKELIPAIFRTTNKIVVKNDFDNIREGLGNPNTLFHTLFSQTLILIWLTWPSCLKIYEDYKIYVYLEPPKRWLYDIDTHCVYSKHQPYPNWKPKVANMALSGFKTIFTMKQATLLPKKVSGWCSSTPGRGVISWKTTEFISGISDFCSLTADCGLIHQKNPVPL